MRMRVEPASSAFSSSSFTTDAGRSTTSPAAIWLATLSGRTWILPMSQWSVASVTDSWLQRKGGSRLAVGASKTSVAYSFPWSVGMKHAILGAGAIGGLVGTVLSSLGEEVTVVVRLEKLPSYPDHLTLERPSDRKHAILGAGAIGGLVGTVLSSLGEEVTVVVRLEKLPSYPDHLTLERP